MSLQKNVASQKIVFLMVDATDFATPETGESVTAKYSKDGGGLSACSNTVSEVTSGLYVLTLAATETNAGVCAYQLTAASSADQWLVFYPEDGYAAGISDLISNVSNVLSTLDDNVDNLLTSILVDTGTTLDNKIDSVLQDTNETLDNKIDSVLADTKEINSQCDSILADTIYIISYCCASIDSSGVTSALALLKDGTVGLDALETLISDVASTLDSSSVGLAVIETIASDILSTLDDNVASELIAIKSDVTAVYSALSDFEAANAGSLSDVRSGITGVYSALSDFEATAAGDVTEIKSDITAVYSALSDFEATIVSDVTAVKSSVSDVLAMSTGNSNLLSALENLVDSVESTIDGPIASQLSSIEADTASILADTKTTLPASISDLLSTIDGAGLKPVTAEPGAGAPGATIPTGEKIDYLYTVFRNKIETTSGTQKVYNDAGAVVLFSCALTDDATTFTKEEHA